MTEPKQPPVYIPMSRYGHKSVSVEVAKVIVADKHSPYFEEAQKVLREGVHWIPSP